MGTGFGVNREVRRSRKAGKEESNVLDRAGCPIIEFLFLIYVSPSPLDINNADEQVAKILKRSMTSETLILDDLPHLAEEVRKTGYRSVINEKEGTIKLDDEEIAPKQKMITSWELIRVLWKGRTWVICTSMSPPLMITET